MSVAVILHPGHISELSTKTVTNADLQIPAPKIYSIDLALIWDSVFLRSTADDGEGGSASTVFENHSSSSV